MAELQPSEEIPIGEPIIPPYNGSKVLPVARLLLTDKTAGVSPEAEEVEESDDSLLEEITVSLLALSVIMVNFLKMIRS